MGGNPSKPDYSKSLQVVGAGMSRTGTTSMQLALERLLEGPVSHGGSNLMRGEGGNALPSILPAARTDFVVRTLEPQLAIPSPS